MRGKSKKRIRSVMAAALPFLVFVSGIALMLYPTVSDWWNSLHQSRAIRAYTEKVAELESGEYEPFWKEATEYNQNLSSGAYLKKMTEEEQTEYERLLNVTGNGMMGYVEIPSINCLLPVYHGTDEAVLQIAVGHIAGTALPVGGEGTHCVLSSHRGLPSARLFTDLDQLEEGDTFRLHILDGVLTYQVDRILTVEPDETEALAPEEGKDYCTLVTCTPYGVNTHRLLVRGVRVQAREEIGTPACGETEMKSISAEYLLIIPILAVLSAATLLFFRRAKSGRKNGRQRKQ